MRKTFAALGLAVAVPVALAAPALAKSPDTHNNTQFVRSVLRQHEGYRAEVTYLCAGPKHQEGTITVSLRQPPKPGASDDTTVGSAQEEAKCDGKEREDKIKIPLGAEPVRTDQKVWLYTTLVVNGVRVADETSTAEPVVDDSAPTPAPTVTTSPSPNPYPSATETEDRPTATPNPDPSATETEDRPTATPNPNPSPTKTEDRPTPTPNPSPTS